MKKDFDLKDQDIIRLGSHLENKKIALLITGSIAAYKTPSLVRHFRQYGAEVQVYLTEEAERYVAEDALEWTSTNPVIKNLTAKAEHLYEHDAYVVAPATLNTIGQIADGKATNAVTTTLASALGRLQKKNTSILVAPAMHGTMEDNPAYQRNLERLKSFGVEIIKPEIRYGKANLSSPHNIVIETIRKLSKSPLKEKQFLITAGPTPGKIDNIRVLTNRFRGTLGIMIADEAYMRGANVTLILGSTGIQAPKYLNTILIKDFHDYHSKVQDVLEHETVDVGIFSAAVADYVPSVVFDGKIPSRGDMKSIPLKHTTKIIEEVRKQFPKLLMVTFKYEEKVSWDELKAIAQKRARQGYQLVVANRGEDLTPEGSYRGIIMSKDGEAAESHSKEECAVLLLNLLET
ncbi:MAG: bifunctional phosphopantothenoylcysteine decarboxylase/phosphopantothenate--cysteine ligase CoaBC [Candidatus Bathyarchaeota archaeon]|nr:MAG: bifunctional phosphopantothenoylcysteine decarboxylase/phosphopantothenate--cysteine ligase CoaBC [Candidatus Bathyarchaeota archaeon]